MAAPFPIYEYNKFGDRVASGSWFEDAMLYDCEKAFVIIVTDGLPSRDDFDSDPADTALGFANFGTGGMAGLIGNYYADAETEEPGTADEAAYYLDDIAKYMYDKDFRPDLGGTQTIDTYTVGFATSTATDDYLERTAVLGNGTFYKVKDGDQLTAALLAAMNDIIEKSASFTAATVPSARTADGADFYQSFFFPRGKSAFWEGHVRAWEIDALGAVRDKNGACALDDPTAGECDSGPFKPDAVFHWDAGDEVPLPASRNLYVSKSGVASGSIPPDFDQANIAYTDLGLDAFAVAPDPAPNSPLYAINGSTATTEEGLADEIVAHARGCFFGTGVASDVATPLACAERPARLGDIFHSNAVAIRKPSLRLTDPGYSDFKDFYSSRSRVLYAGTNAGFLEAIDTGTWVVVVDPDDPRTPPYYSRGTGAELFGFMPWQARQTIKNLTIDAPDRPSSLRRRRRELGGCLDRRPESREIWVTTRARPMAPSGTPISWAPCAREETTITRWMSPIPLETSPLETSAPTPLRSSAPRSMEAIPIFRATRGSSRPRAIPPREIRPSWERPGRNPSSRRSG